MSKYWLKPHVSGRRKGKEKVWAHETSQRTKRRNAVPAPAEEQDLAAMPVAGPASVTMVPAPLVRGRPLPSSLRGESAELIGQPGSGNLSLAPPGC